MILKFFTFVLLILSGVARISAFNETKDTMAAAMPEIRVEAGRLEAFAGNRYSPVVTIGKAKIRESGSMQASEVVAGVPGLYVKNFGGAGGIKIVSLRGTTSQQAVYMIDGIKINSAQTGAVDLGLIPLFMLESIDVVRGGASALYGGNSLGGVINFATIGNSGKPEISADVVLGSFGEYVVSGGTNIPLGDWFAGINAEYMNSTGDFPFEFNNFGNVSTYYRQNSDFRNIAVMLKTGCEGSDYALNFNLLARDSERGVPGAVLQNKIGDSPDRLVEGEALFSAGFTHWFDKSYFALSLAGKASGSEYNSDKALGYLNEIEFLEKYAVFSAKYGFAALGLMNAEIMTEVSYNDIDYYYSGSVMDFRKRTAASVALKGETESIISNSDITLSLLSGIRFDAYSEGFSAFSPVVSVLTTVFGGALAARLQWAYNFRPPNFSELYYLNFGNRNLRPEKSDSYNLGITWQHAGFLQISADAFVIDSRDQILSVPVSPVAWSAVNFAGTLARGAELTASAGILDNLLNLYINYTYQETTDESAGNRGAAIPYVPGEMLSAGAGLRDSAFAAGISAEYTGFRYTLPGNNKASVLPDYLLINLYASCRLTIAGIDIKLRLDALNLFDVRYQAVKNYPMPGRQFRLSINGIYEL